MLVTDRHWTFNAALGLAFAVMGAVILAFVPGQIDKPPVLFGMPSTSLSPRAMPRAAAILMIVVGLVYFVQGLRLTEANGMRALSRQAIRNVGFLLVTMIFYVAVLIPLGFVLSSMLTALAITLYFGSRHPFGVGLVAVGGPLLIYLLFTRELSVSLPPFPLLPGF